MEIISKLLLVLVLSILRTMVGYAAPLLNAKNTWNVFEPVIKVTCSVDGQCWELPVPETYDATVVALDEDNDVSRLQSRRQVASPIPDIASKPWKNGILEEMDQKVRPPLSNDKPIPIRSKRERLLVSRLAAGMPFSVLYMNQRSNHVGATTSTAERQESDAPIKSLTSSVERHPSYQRNRQPTIVSSSRRPFLNIPSLFISRIYGWSALKNRD